MITTPGKGREVMLMGGQRGGSKLTETIIYNLSTHAWRRGPSIPTSAVTSTVSVFILSSICDEAHWLSFHSHQPYVESYGEGLIFMGGGSSVLQFDPTKNRFAVRPEASMPGAFGTVAKGKLCD